MDKVFKYLGYSAAALLVGWLSTLGAVDYVGSLSSSVIQLLITLLALYSTIASLLVSRMLHLRDIDSISSGIPTVVKSLKRNVIIESILIFATFVIIVLSQVAINQGWINNTITETIRNSMIVFSIMYFVIVVYDSSMGLYSLLEFEADRGKDKSTKQSSGE